jgi:hypothetical protein
MPKTKKFMKRKTNTSRKKKGGNKYEIGAQLKPPRIIKSKNNQRDESAFILGNEVINKIIFGRT